MGVISMKQLLEAGVHFGHQTRRWNPKMAEYIYCLLYTSCASGRLGAADGTDHHRAGRETSGFGLF